MMIINLSNRPENHGQYDQYGLDGHHGHDDHHGRDGHHGQECHGPFLTIFFIKGGGVLPNPKKSLSEKTEVFTLSMGESQDLGRNSR